MITFSSKIASFPPFCYFVQIPAKKIQHKYIPMDGIIHANSKAAPSYIVTSNGWGFQFLHILVGITFLEMLEKDPWVLEDDSKYAREE